jgi:hypothetical protein
MDNPIDSYRAIVRDVILEFATHKPSHGDIATRAVIDEERDSYQVVDIGWQGKRRVFGVILHIDIIDDKIWIQYDGTEHGVATTLVEAGIPRAAIVLGFKPKHVRPHTQFAVT